MDCNLTDFGDPGDRGRAWEHDRSADHPGDQFWLTVSFGGKCPTARITQKGHEAVVTSGIGAIFNYAADKFVGARSVPRVSPAVNIIAQCAVSVFAIALMTAASAPSRAAAAVLAADQGAVRLKEQDAPITFTKNQLLDDFFDVMNAEGNPDFLNRVENLLSINLVASQNNDPRMLTFSLDNKSKFSFSVFVNFGRSADFAKHPYFTFYWSDAIKSQYRRSSWPPTCVEANVMEDRLTKAGWHLYEKVTSRGKDAAILSSQKTRYFYMDDPFTANAKRELAFNSKDETGNCIESISISGVMPTVAKIASIMPSDKIKFDEGYAAFENAQYVEAARILTPLAERGFARAQLVLAVIYSNGGFGISQNPQEALIWYKRAADGGDADAQFFMAERESDLDKRLQWLIRSARQGYARAIDQLAKYYYQDSQDKTNLDSAYRLSIEAATKGDIGAQSRLGEMYISGLGVKCDMIKGLMWLDLAAHLPRDSNERVIWEDNPNPETRRNEVAARMSPEQVTIADGLAEDFRQRNNLKP